MILSSRHKRDDRAAVLSICRTLCLCATWVQATTALPQGATKSDDVAIAAVSEATFALIPSAPKVTALIPSAPPPPPPLTGIVPSAPISTWIIPSQSRPLGLIPSQPAQPAQNPPSGLIPSQPLVTGLIPSQPVQTEPATPGIIPSEPLHSGSEVVSSATLGPADSSVPKQPPPSGTDGFAPPLVSMVSTDEGLRPIPAPTTAPGDPDGHNEITEPNLTATAPCRGCSPVIEVSVTGFLDWPTSAVADHAGSSKDPEPTKATVTAGQSQLIISKEPTGPNFVVGGPTSSQTVAPGQTITVDNTPIVIQTTAGSTQVIIANTQTVPLVPESPQSQITEAPVVPLLQPVTIGSSVITANGNTQYIVADQTLLPGGSAITVDGTTISLLASASAIVINGKTTTIAQAYGNILTSTATPTLLTINDHVYTANRAGYYILAPGVTLIPGGAPVTLSGTTVSLEPHGTTAVIQGSTSLLTPVTTFVTLTRGGGYGGQALSTGAAGYFAPQGTGKASSAGVSGFVHPAHATDGWLGSILLLGWIGFGWLAIRL